MIIMSHALFQNSKRYGWKNHMSIMKKVNTLCNSSNLNELYLNDNNSSTYIKNIQLTKREKLSSHQYNLVTNIKKLKFYSIFKNDRHKSDCFNIITNINHKKTLNKFRLGNHRLQIETGKHTVQYVVLGHAWSACKSH